MNTLSWTLKMVVAVASLLACGRALGQAYTTVDLRGGAGARVGSAVVLKDIAVVAGPDADRLATVVVHEPAAAGDVTLTREQVRKALDNAGAVWGRTLLRGRGVLLRVEGEAAAAAAPAGAPAVVAPAKGATDVSAVPRGGVAASRGSLGMLLVEHVAERCGVSAADVRLSTESSAPADAELLAGPADPGLAYRLVVAGSSVAGRTQVKIEAFGADRLALNRTVTVDLLVRKSVTVAAVPLQRTAVVGAGDVKVEDQWLPYSQASRLVAADPDRLLGSALKRRVDVGRVVTAEDVAAPLVVKRGDEVTVSIVSGGIMLRSKGRALGSARDNELVTVELLDDAGGRGEKRSARIVTARMNGRGHAVVAAGE